jgi:hypothetical protein
MAVFRPTKTAECELNFDDKFIYHIPLHEDTLRSIAKLSEKQVEALSALNPEDEDAMNKAYNMALDAVDGILGEGAGADIMSLYERPSITDVAEVVRYITEEVSGQYKKLMEKYKTTGSVPPVKTGTKRGRR